MNLWVLLGASTLSALLGSALACVPGLHVYNVLGGGVLLAYHLSFAGGAALPASAVGAVFASAIGAYSVVSAIPAVFLSAPDESAAFVVQPSHWLRSRGRGFEAVLLMASGCVVGMGLLLLVLLGVGRQLLPVVRAVLQPHLHWILWAVIAFMLLSEWPRGGTHAGRRRERLIDGWRSLTAGFITFVLAGFLGFVLFHRPPYPAAMSFQGLMPAFLGLYTLPWLVMGAVCGGEYPLQSFGAPRLSGRVVAHGGLAGALGGAVAAFVPGVTGGVGGMLASQATALRGDREFLISQGASKSVYYLGGFLLLFLPGVHVVRGGGAALAQSLTAPPRPGDLYAIAGAATIGLAVGVGLLPSLSRFLAGAGARLGVRRLSIAGLGLVLLLVLVTTGVTGLGVAVVACGIGMLPSLYGARRMHCLAVILLPLACSLSGVDGAVAGRLGLI